MIGIAFVGFIGATLIAFFVGSAQTDRPAITIMGQGRLPHLRRDTSITREAGAEGASGPEAPTLESEFDEEGSTEVEPTVPEVTPEAVPEETEGGSSTETPPRGPIYE